MKLPLKSLISFSYCGNDKPEQTRNLSMFFWVDFSRDRVKVKKK